MGTLKPGVNYIYERVDNKVYAREFGADPETRTIIGYQLENPVDPYFKNMADKYFLEVEWAAILKEAEHNPTLQEAIERVKIIYHLSKKNEQE